MTVPRTSVLPGIKCSSCGADVDLAMMGDHKCSYDAQGQRLYPDPAETADSHPQQTTQDPNHLRTTTTTTSSNHDRVTSPPSGYSSKPTSPLQYEIPLGTESDSEQESEEEEEAEMKPEPEVRSGPYSAAKLFRRKPSPIDPAAANGVRSNSDPLTPGTSNKSAGDSAASTQPSAQSTFSFPQRSATLPSEPFTPLTAPSEDEHALAGNKQPPERSCTRQAQDNAAPRLTPDTGPRTPSVYMGPYPQPGTLFPPTNPNSSSSSSTLPRRSMTTIERKPVPSLANGEPEEKKIFGLFRRKSSRQLSKKSISAPGIRAPEPVPAVPDVPSAIATPGASAERLARFDSEAQLLPNKPAPPRPARPGEVDEVLEHLQLTKNGGTLHAQPGSPERKSPPPVPVIRDDAGEELSISDQVLKQSWPKRSSDASIYSLAASTPPARAPPTPLTQTTENMLSILAPTRAPLRLDTEPVEPQSATIYTPTAAPAKEPTSILSPAQTFASEPSRISQPEAARAPSPPLNDSDFEDEEDFVAELPLKIPTRTSSKKAKLRPARFSVEPELPAKKSDDQATSVSGSNDRGTTQSLQADSKANEPESEIDNEPVGELPSSIPQPGTHGAMTATHRRSPTESTSSSDESHLGSDGRTNSSVSSPPTSNASSFSQWKQAAESANVAQSTAGPEPSHHIVSSSTSSAGRAANFSRPRAPTGASASSTSSNPPITISPVKIKEPKLETIPSADSPTDPTLQQPLQPFPIQAVDSPSLVNGLDTPPASATTSPADLAPTKAHKFHPTQITPSLPPTPEDSPISRFPSPISATCPQNSITRRPTNPSAKQPPTKGPCRGCGLDITGKSVKAADGRLSGRYHRDCFVCTTCRAPFPNASFYVLHDEPFCRAHYHALNGSVCLACRSGIEGSYFEILGRRKFHTDCFACCECRVGLKGDYFEIGGRFYCERDARAAHQRGMQRLGPSGLGPRFPERRRTKLMAM